MASASPAATATRKCARGAPRVVRRAEPPGPLRGHERRRRARRRGGVAELRSLAEALERDVRVPGSLRLERGGVRGVRIRGGRRRQRRAAPGDLGDRLGPRVGRRRGGRGRMAAHGRRDGRGKGGGSVDDDVDTTASRSGTAGIAGTTMSDVSPRGTRSASAATSTPRAQSSASADSTSASCPFIRFVTLAARQSPSACSARSAASPRSASVDTSNAATAFPPRRRSTSKRRSTDPLNLALRATVSRVRAHTARKCSIASSAIVRPTRGGLVRVASRRWTSRRAHR